MTSAWLLAALLAGPARAAFEEAPLSARAAAMGGAMTAVGGEASSFVYNPAALSALRRPTLEGSYLRQHRIPAGIVDQEPLGVFGGAALPGERQWAAGAGYVGNRQKDFALERVFQLGLARRSLWEGDGRSLDAGLGLKFLKRSIDAGGRSALKMALDFGASWHFGEKWTVAASALNLNRPSAQAGGRHDRAPAALKLGIAETLRGFTLAADLTKREPSGRHRGTLTAGLGFERWWATTRSGSWAARTGLSLGDRSRSWSGGAGWRMMGGELGYAMTVPMSGPPRIGHAVTVAMRFGASNPEAEYEKLLAGEVRYRRDLTEALEAAEVKQWRLAEELSRMREEMEILRAQLIDRTASESQARERLKALEGRHKQAVESFEKIRSESRKLAERGQADLFREDWTAYQRLKLGGAPDSVLVDRVKGLLRQYKDSGADLSEANQELLRLMRNAP